jgi:hypothetical protein
VVAPAAIAQLLQQYVASPCVTCVEGSTIGVPQCAHFSAAVRPPSLVATSAQFAQQYSSPRFSSMVV